MGSKILAAGQSGGIGMYDVPWDVSLPGLGIGISVDAFQGTGIRMVHTESLKKEVMHSIDLCHIYFKHKMLSLTGNGEGSTVSSALDDTCD